MARGSITVGVLPQAKALVEAEVKRLQGKGEYANEKMVASNCIYQVLGRQGEAQ